MFENKKEQSRREFLKNILRATVFSGLVGIGFIAITKNDGSSTKTNLCSKQRCGRCSLLANCNLPDASSFKESAEKNDLQSNSKNGRSQ